MHADIDDHGVLGSIPKLPSVSVRKLRKLGLMKVSHFFFVGLEYLCIYQPCSAVSALGVSLRTG